MTKKKDAIAILKSFENSTFWSEFKARMEVKKAEIELELDKELVDETPLSIHSLWRRMRDYISGIVEEAKSIFGDVEGWIIILDQINLDILARKTNSYKAVQTDFDKTNSLHDVLRSQRNYIEGMLEYPAKLMDIEQAEREKEDAERAGAELEAIQEGKYIEDIED